MRSFAALRTTSGGDAECAANGRMEVDQRRLVAAVDHLFRGARFEADLHALAQREILVHHRADGDVAVLLPVGVGLVAVLGLVDRHLDVAAARIVAGGGGAARLGCGPPRWGKARQIPVWSTCQIRMVLGKSW